MRLLRSCLLSLKNKNLNTFDKNDRHEMVLLLSTIFLALIIDILVNSSTPSFSIMGSLTDENLFHTSCSRQTCNYASYLVYKRARGSQQNQYKNGEQKYKRLLW